MRWISECRLYQVIDDLYTCFGTNCAHLMFVTSEFWWNGNWDGTADSCDACSCDSRCKSRVCTGTSWWMNVMWIKTDYTCTKRLKGISLPIYLNLVDVFKVFFDSKQLNLREACVWNTFNLKTIDHTNACRKSFLIVISVNKQWEKVKKCRHPKFRIINNY